MISALVRRLGIAMLVVGAIAGVFHGWPQELCATLLYIWIGAGALLLFVERLRRDTNSEEG